MRPTSCWQHSNCRGTITVWINHETNKGVWGCVYKWWLSGRRVQDRDWWEGGASEMSPSCHDDFRESNKGSSNESHHHTCGEKARSGSVAWSLCRNLMRSHRYICTHFPLHSIDDILPDLYRAKVFTVWYGNQPSSWDFPAKVDTSAGGAVGHKH